MTARSELQLYSLGREPFLLTLTGHTQVHGAAHALAEERLAELRALSEAGAVEHSAPGG